MTNSDVQKIMAFIAERMAAEAVKPNPEPITFIVDGTEYEAVNITFRKGGSAGIPIWGDSGFKVAMYVRMAGSRTKSEVCEILDREMAEMIVTTVLRKCTEDELAWLMDVPVDRAGHAKSELVKIAEIWKDHPDFAAYVSVR